MADPARNIHGRFTYEDYVKWPENERWELIDGVPYDMSPAPAQRHQAISGDLFAAIHAFLLDKDCRVYAAPFDVLLPDFPDQGDDEVETVVQPDIVVVCDRKKLSEKGCRGAPDWVVEILSPHTSLKDQREKLALYERHGVKEYWVLHPTDRVVTAHVLGPDRRFAKPRVYGPEDKADPAVLPGLSIELKQVFQRSEL